MGKAFTLVEILLVLGITTILVSVILTMGIDFYNTRQLDIHARGIVQSLRKAQSKAAASENDSNFGVFLTNDNYILFKGDSYALRDSQYDEIFDLPQVLTVGGIQEIVFSKSEGLPSVSGNIVLSNDTDGRTININPIGRINLE